MIAFQNSDPSKNIGTKTGRRFAVGFVIQSYYIYEDGTTELAKADSVDDFVLFYGSDELVKFDDHKQIKW